MTQTDHAQRTDIHRTLQPASVAVVGASRDESKRGHMILQTLDEWGYTGAVYPVNPKHAGEQINGNEVYASVSDIPGPVDLACIVTPAAVVPRVIEDCGAADVGGALVIAAGFGEIGNDELEAELLEVANEHGIRLIGPNTNGLINVHHSLDLLSRRDIPQGGIAMLSQSGNIASALVYEAMHEDAEGFSFYISVGNETDITFDEYLPFLREHEQTKMAMCYVEGMTDGRTFLREASSFVREKPITVLKGGLSSVGKQSAESHTASIAGRGSVVEDVYRQAGIVQVERADELLAVSETLANVPPADGPNVGILSDGGGHATHAADCLTDHGLRIPDLEPETQETIRAAVPDQAPNTVNPVDVLTLEYDIDIYADCAEAMLQDPNIDALLLCGYFGGYGINWGAGGNDKEVAVAERITDLLPRYETPIVTQSMFAQHDSPALAVLDDSRIPVFESINTATRALSALETYGRHLATADRKSHFVIEGDTTPSRLVTDALAAGRTQLSEFEARALLDEYDAPVTPSERATTRAEAVEAAARFDGPVALKVLSSEILHKSDAGGVMLDLTGRDAVGSAYDAIVQNMADAYPDAAIDGVLVSPMVDDGVELIVGLTQDEEVGPVVMFGLGGVFVEVLEDVSFRAIPVTEFDARQMVEEIQAAELLQGARGQGAVDTDAIVDLIATISDIAAENPQITELDVNPAIATSDGLQIVDAAVTLDAD